MTASGLVIVDKPGGWTSHDVVAAIRRLAGTKRVGHAGTLDPMATGVLVVGVDRATRLLGHLTLTEKQYAAAIRLGQVTDTDDADGAVTGSRSAAGLTREQLLSAAARFTGDIEQVPPAVSAIKVNGQRAYRLARQGKTAELAARSVTVRQLTVRDIRADGELLDLDVDVTCSSGTYIRAIARDLGAALGVGGHLTALRRIRVGPYDVTAARTLDQLAVSLAVIPLADAAAAAFARRDLNEAEALLIARGGRLPAGPGAVQRAGSVPGPARGSRSAPGPGAAVMPIAAFGPDGALIALLTEADGVARSLAVFVG